MNMHKNTKYKWVELCGGHSLILAALSYWHSSFLWGNYEISGQVSQEICGVRIPLA